MMDKTRDRLDEAIDRAAVSLVSVEDDAVTVGRLVAHLPARPDRRGWFGLFVPQAAVAVVIAVLAFTWTMRDRNEEVREPIQARPVALVESSSAAVESIPPPVAIPVTRVRRVAAPPARVNTLAEMPDHERSLEPVAAPRPLEIASLDAPLLPDEAPVVVAPIVLTELPLSGEWQSPR